MRSIDDVKRYIKNNMNLSFDALKFMELEILFRLAERIGQTTEIDKLYMLLSRGDVIYEKRENFSERNFLIANARVLLKTMSHAKVFRDTFNEYQFENNQRYAFYKIEDNCLKQKENAPSIYEDRILDYDNLLDRNEKELQRERKIANYEESYLARVNEKNDIQIQFENLNVKSRLEKKRLKKGGKIKISMKEVMISADELDQLEGKNYRRKVLEGNIYNTGEGDKTKTNEIYIDGVVNLAGQVGAGKSTFADALSSVLVKKGYRVVMVLATVDDVLKKYKLLNKLGYEVYTLIGNYSRSKHIDNQIIGKEYLEEHVSEVLQQPCLLNAIIENTENIIKYGQEPCTILKKKDGINYVCPYYDFCPRTENDRKIHTSDIIITTLEGFCYCNFNSNRENFLEYAISNFDLVIMDEIDNILCSLDHIFAPVLAVNDYIVKNTKYCSSHQSDTYENKCKDMLGKGMVCSKINKLQDFMKLISNQVKEHKTGWSDTDLKSFSALSLLFKIKPYFEDELDEKIWKTFYDLLRPHSVKKGDIREIGLINAIDESGISTNNMILWISQIISYKNEINAELIEKKLQEKDVKILKKLEFILNVLKFEQVYRELSNLVENLQEVPIEIREILSRVLSTQQKYIPSSPIGNIFEIEVRDDDIYIKKQFAFGRALALKMPYLVLNLKGNPMGANVLLMSGTGYMPGSERYHVGDKVDYVIEAEKIKRDYIAKTKIYNLKSEHWVSGVDKEYKNQNLKALVQEQEVAIKKCIENNEKILMIVNSYEQCKVAGMAVEKILMKYKLDLKICFLKSDSGELEYDFNNNGLQRRDVTNFKGDILIAPACVIGRGYNIVDALGNAWFDSVMFLVRPLPDPRDYNIYVQRVNGYIINKYKDLTCTNRVEIIEDMRKDAFKHYSEVSEVKGNLSDLPDYMKTDIIAALFVTIEQVFGRLCRLGSNIKEKIPKIYFIDGAFNATKEGKFDTFKELQNYLKYLIEDSPNQVVAKTLYEPFYEALKGAK